MSEYLQNYAGKLRHVARRDALSGLWITEMSGATLRKLCEYSITLPTSPNPGRVWRCKRRNYWVLGYCYPLESSEQGVHGLGWRRIIVTDECRACEGRGGEFEPGPAHTDHWVRCSPCKGLGYIPREETHK